MKINHSCVLLMAVAAVLCGASNVAHATPKATFTDSWKDGPVTYDYPETTGSFSFRISLPFDGQLTSSLLDSNSQFTFNIGPVGNTIEIFSDTLGDAQELRLGTSGSATYFLENGTLTLTWTATTMTASGAATIELLGNESYFASNSDGTASDNTFANIVETNEVSVTLDASDNSGGTFNYDNQNVPGTIKNTETEYTNPGGSTIPLEAGTENSATTGISFTDTWKDSPAPDDYAATTGAFSFSASLPVAGELTTSDLDSNSVFSLSIGPEGGPVPIFSLALGDAQQLHLGASGSATFTLFVLNQVSGNYTPTGSLAVIWNTHTITVTGSATSDFLGQESMLTNDSDGYGPDNSYTTGITNEVVVTLDASDNNGGTFNYDTNAVGIFKNKETDQANPGGLTFALETGSLSGAAPGLSFSDTWTDKATTDYYAGTTGSATLSISLPLNGLLDITNAGFDVSDLGTNSQLSISIGSVTNPSTVFSSDLGHANHFTANRSGGSATFSSASKGTLTFAWTTTTLTVTASTVFDLLGEEQLFATNSDGIPGMETITGFYEIGVVINDTNGGLYTFYDPNVPVTGKNTETEHTNLDGTTFALEVGTITGTADFTPPVVTITSPASGFKVYNANSVIELEGTAKDNVGIVSLLYYVNGETNNEMEIPLPTTPPVSISWSNAVDFNDFGTPGTFTVSVIAIDSVGNQSAPVTRSFQWVQTNSATLAVSPRTAGKITGLANGQLLQVGNGYSVTAVTTNKNFLFSQWTDMSGDVLSSNATFEYFDTDGTLTANFVPNPFTNATLAGTYTGLFYDSVNSVEPVDSGYLTVKVTSTGGYSGQLSVAPAASPFSFSGQLAMSSDDSIAGTTFPIKVGATESLAVNLLLTNLANPDAAMLGGTVTAYGGSNLLDTAQVQGKLSLVNSNVTAGLYNLCLAGPPVMSASFPGGYSYGSANVGKTGSVALVLNLADGTSPAVSFASSMAHDGSCPYYASLYGGKGVILGWLQFATDGSGTIVQNDTSTLWVKEPLADKFYTNGFSGNLSGLLFGSLYTAPKAGTRTNVFGWTNGFFFDASLNVGPVSGEIDVPVTFNPTNNTFVIAHNTNSLSITFTPTTGALTGSFTYPVGSRNPFTYHGVDVSGFGYGFFVDTNMQTGPIVISPPVP